MTWFDWTTRRPPPRGGPSDIAPLDVDAEREQRLNTPMVRDERWLRLCELAAESLAESRRSTMEYVHEEIRLRAPGNTHRQRVARMEGPCVDQRIHNPNQRKGTDNDTPFLTRAADAAAIAIGISMVAISWPFAVIADGPRLAIADQHPPRTEIVRLDADGWATRTSLWCEDGNGGLVLRPCDFARGDWSHDGTSLFLAVMLDIEPQAANGPGFVASQKKACTASCISGCCPGWSPGQPPCVNFGWAAFEVMANPDGTPGGFACSCCCVSDGLWDDCNVVPSWAD